MIPGLLEIAFYVFVGGMVCCGLGVFFVKLRDWIYPRYTAKPTLTENILFWGGTLLAILGMIVGIVGMVIVFWQTIETLIEAITNGG